MSGVLYEQPNTLGQAYDTVAKDNGAPLLLFPKQWLIGYEKIQKPSTHWLLEHIDGK